MVSERETTAVEVLDRAFHSIMTSMVETAVAPHYTELASGLGVVPDEARAILHDLVAVIPGWVHPGTDYLASFPPFNVQPTQYRISVDGKPGWYGQ